MQIVVHLRNTQASSRKELPAALRRRSGHESSADWPTATEQQDKNVAAAYSCLFSSVPSFCSVLFCSIVLFSLVLSSLGSALCSILSSVRSIGLLFSRPYSLALALALALAFECVLLRRFHLFRGLLTAVVSLHLDLRPLKTFRGSCDRFW